MFAPVAPSGSPRALTGGEHCQAILTARHGAAGAAGAARAGGPVAAGGLHGRACGGGGGAYARAAAAAGSCPTVAPVLSHGLAPNHFARAPLYLCSWRWSEHIRFKIMTPNMRSTNVRYSSLCPNFFMLSSFRIPAATHDIGEACGGLTSDQCSLNSCIHGTSYGPALRDALEGEGPQRWP